MFFQENLVADIGRTANVTNPAVVNPWGIVVNKDNSYWSTLNGSSNLALFSEDGNQLLIFPTGEGPTGLAKVSSSPPGGAELFLVTENGQIQAYIPSIGPNPIVTKYTDPTAVYKGIAIFKNLLYAANFNNFKVDVFNIMNIEAGPIKSIIDPTLSTSGVGYGPFNVYTDGDVIFISYALLEPTEKRDDQKGPGNGYVNIYNGIKTFRLINRGPLNSPWGLLRVGNNLYVGNFGDGFINVYKLQNNCGKLHASFCGPIVNQCNTPIQIDGLWGISQKRLHKTISNIWFASGSEDENHGLIGLLHVNKCK